VFLEEVGEEDLPTQTATTRTRVLDAGSLTANKDQSFSCTTKEGAATSERLSWMMRQVDVRDPYHDD
jgi:hypothetical protein